jgi:HK97 family phage major capsid protein
METIFYREARFDRKAVDLKKRTVTICFSSETPVQRDGYSEVLSHRTGDYDFSRLNAGAPLLLNHDPEKQIGVVESAKVESDASGRKVGRAVVRFSKSPLGDEMFNDVQDGIRKHVSVGYAQTSRIQGGDGNNCIRFKWMPYELTLTPIPADITTGVGRAIVTKENRKFMTNNEDRMEATSLGKIMAHDHPHIADGIKALNARLFCNDLNLDQYRKEILTLAQNNQPRTQLQTVGSHEAGMSQRDIKGYSLTRALSKMAENPGARLRNCPEADLSDQVERNCKQAPEGLWIPAEVCLGSSRRDFMKRDLQATVYGAGGALVATDMVTPMIELLRNRTVCLRLGALSLAGLEGNVTIPRQTAADTAQSVSEVGPFTSGNPILDQIALAPNRVGATCVYSKRLLIQSSIDVENMVRDDLMQVVAILHDELALAGTGGGSQPLGILGTPGINSILFGGTATWAQVLAFETALGLANADRGRLGWVTSPTVKGRWKGIAVNLIGATTVAAVPLWGRGTFPADDDSTDGLVNDYRAASTNQIPNNQVLFGNWRDLVIGMWGGFDVVVNPYSLDTTAQVRITVNTFIDIALRHAQSFCVSADSGAQ